MYITTGAKQVMKHPKIILVQMTAMHGTIYLKILFQIKVHIPGSVWAGILNDCVSLELCFSN